MDTVAAVCTAIHFKYLCITFLVFCLCTDMSQFPAIMADIIAFIFKYLHCHVVILAYIVLKRPCLTFFMLLQFNITFNTIFLQCFGLYILHSFYSLVSSSNVGRNRYLRLTFHLDSPTGSLIYKDNEHWDLTFDINARQLIFDRWLFA